MALSTGTDGTPAARGSGVGSFRSFVSFGVTCNRLLCQAIEVFTEGSVHLLLHITHLLFDINKTKIILV